MRLSAEEIQVIKNQIVLRDRKARIFLYGSRTDDSKKGGDIDLYVLSEVLGFSEKISILADIKSRLGDQKIDLTIETHEAAEKNPFFQQIQAAALEL